MAEAFDPNSMVVGFGHAFCQKLGVSIEGHKNLPDFKKSDETFSGTNQDLWIWLNGEDRGHLFHQTRKWISLLFHAFELDYAVESFIFDKTRDLTGYEDGTENPEGDNAIGAAVLDHSNPKLNGSSFVAVQQWLHNFTAIDEKTASQMDDIIGRRRTSNEEFDEAPKSAHVKRSAQESFNPEAFMVRRSMPWVEGDKAGLMFIAFGHSFQAFEMIFERMIGKDDGIIDGLFQISQPIRGSYFWCPPLADNTLNLSALTE